MPHEFINGRCCYNCRYIFLATAEGEVKIYFCTILFIAGEGSQSCIHFLDGRTPVVISKNLKELEELFGECELVRCHKSYIVNTNFVSRTELGKSGYAFLDNKSKVDVSGKYKEYLLARVHGIKMQSPTFSEDEKKDAGDNHMEFSGGDDGGI